MIMMIMMVVMVVMVGISGGTYLVTLSRRGLGLGKGGLWLCRGRGVML